MTTRDAKIRAANMREIFTFDDDMKFQIRSARGGLIASCETLTDAQRVLDGAEHGAFIAFPRGALDAENSRRDADEAARLHNVREAKKKTLSTELHAASHLGFVAQAVQMMQAGRFFDDAPELVKALITPDVVGDVNEQVRGQYERALTEFLLACDANGRVLENR